MNETANKAPKTGTIDMKLEIVVVPVSDVDRAKTFYASLGWRLDADFASDDDWRVIQFTPPGSPTSVIFGKNVTGRRPVPPKACTSSSPTSRRLAKNYWVVASRSVKSFTAPATFTPARTSPICPDGAG